MMRIAAFENKFVKDLLFSSVQVFNKFFIFILVWLGNKSSLEKATTVKCEQVTVSGQ